MRSEPDDADRRWMELAIEESRRCTPSASAYSVGAIIIGADGRELARGYSREGDPHVHAEEAALAKLPAATLSAATLPAAILPAATLYSTLEPCSQRQSRPRSCAELILDAGIGRVVIAWREPGLFVADCLGYEQLTRAGVTVVELPELADRARAVNAHLGLGPDSARRPLQADRPPDPGADAVHQRR
jgi:diaminohydroxyphosphoribosylaminopyrimidine deaminase/5-amino-6-(5-phosphoribosylamino)uracil reductase